MIGYNSTHRIYGFGGAPKESSIIVNEGDYIEFILCTATIDGEPVVGCRVQAKEETRLKYIMTGARVMRSDDPEDEPIYLNHCVMTTEEI